MIGRFTVARVRYAKSGVHGFGAFAAQPIREGDLISTLQGAWLRKSAKDAPTKRWRKWLVYSFRHGNRTVFFRGPMKFVNHSCDPNIRWDDDRCFAVRAIAEGDELFEDYSQFASPSLKIECNCGAAECRGVVVGRRKGQAKETMSKQSRGPVQKPEAERRTRHIDKYLPYDVVEAARQRIAWLYDNFDCPLVSFSGGKDSLALLLLTIEFCRPLGLKVHAGFIDEEFVPTSTLNFVKWVLYESEFAEHIVPHWFCWQMDSEIYCAGESRSIVQWGADREEWLREPPEGALMDRRNVYDIFSPDAPLAELFAGKSVVSLLGVRAGESLARLATVRYSAASDKHPCFLRAGQTSGVFRAVPLYDWVTNDVLKYLGDRNCINPIYYEMLVAGKTLRTDTPLHGRRCNIAAFKKIDPEFFERLCSMFPEVHAAALYNTETKPLAELVNVGATKYGKTWNGLLEYIRAEITGDSQIERAETCLKEAAKKHMRLLRRGLSGIPLLRIWKLIVNRDFDHSVGVDHWSAKDYEWEGKTPPSEIVAGERQDEAEVSAG